MEVPDLENVKILIVEDDELVQDSLQTILESEGYETLKASDGLTAKDLTDKEFINLILLDVELPDISGIELAKKIRVTIPQMRKIFLTGHNDGTLEIEQLKKFADAYVIKPYDIDFLLEVISRNLEEQRNETLSGHGTV
ncbi:response regulator [Candidatus Bathyarchaeota archaeon]|nr:response regulator [Candidatus Bathyarchaeota archaeon]